MDAFKRPHPVAVADREPGKFNRRSRGQAWGAVPAEVRLASQAHAVEFHLGCANIFTTVCEHALADVKSKAWNVGNLSELQ